MNFEPTTTSYFLYARKSSEAEDRQIQSIDDQVTRLRELARQRGLAVLQEFTESRSAKQPGSRPIFARLLDDIEKGKANGILCWQLNRLSRNPIESGRLAWMLQTGTLRSIVTSDREHLPDDNALILSVETGMANQFIRELSRNVKRGNLGKLERGELPGRAPVGYLNDRVQKKVIRDPERFGQIRRAWELIISGQCSVPEIGRWLDNQGFVTLKRGRSGGGRMTLSALYAIFDNPFFAGIIRRNGREYPGSHEPMISIEEFGKAQRFLHRSSAPRPRKHAFTFARLFRCAECGSMITADKHFKLSKSTGQRRAYTYYHCGHHRHLVDCSQRRHASEHELEHSIAVALRSFALPPELGDQAVRVLRRTLSDIRASETSEADVNTAEEQGSALIQMRYRGLITDAEFSQQREALKAQIDRAKSAVGDQPAQEARLARVTRSLELLVGIHNRFERASSAAQRAILEALCSNRTILDGKPMFGGIGLLAVATEYNQEAQRRIVRFEPDQAPDKSIQKDASASLLPLWRAMIYDFGRAMFSVDDETFNEAIPDVPPNLLSDCAGATGDPSPCNIVHLAQKSVAPCKPKKSKTDRLENAA